MKTLLRYLAVVTVLWLGSPGGWRLRAQAGPPGGAPLREVARLARVAEPPGGLIPYRAGKLWGYADTTGRVVIAPVFTFAPMATWFLNPPFFSEGFVHLPFESLPPPLRAATGVLFMNARGELLRVKEFEAAVLQADGSLRCLPRRQARGSWELRAHPEQLTEVDQQEFARLQKIAVPRTAADPLRPTTPYDNLYALGPTRASRTNEATPLRTGRPPGSKRLPRYPRYALTDSAGRPLTAYKFSAIRSFSQGLAVAGEQATQKYGYLTLEGKWQVPPTFEAATDFRGGVAVVQAAGKYGIITPDGHFRLPLQRNQLKGPDEAGFVRMLLPSADGTPLDAVRYLPPTNQPAFEQALVAEGGAFLNGRAWAATASRVGLLNCAGQWLTPLNYEALTAPRRLRSLPHDAQDERTAETNLFDEARPLATINPPVISPEDAFYVPADLPQSVQVGRPLPDTAYLVGQRQRRYGIVARATGRETVRARYDSVLYNPYRGIVCLQRADTAYVVACATGRVLAQGAYAGLDFLTMRGRLHYLTREQPAAWALLDTLGRLRTPWIPGTGFPTPEGWLLSHEPQGWTLRDSAGRIGYASPFRIVQPQWSRIWQEVQQWDRKGLDPGMAWELSLADRLDAAYAYARGRFIVEETSQTVFLDRNAHEIGRVAGKSLRMLPSGWGYLDGGHRLFTDEGRPLPAPPPGVNWHVSELFDFPRAWREHGVLPTTQGYLTRGGRRLWE